MEYRVSKEKVRLGVVGVRNIGRAHIRRALPLEHAVIAAIADTDPVRLAEAAAEFGIETTYGDARTLFADPTLDGVILAVPNHLHATLTAEALEAGKHVLVEKPMARNATEAQTMIDARDRTGKILMVGMNQRFTPVVYAIKQQIENGSIGDVYYGRTRWIRRRPGAGLWDRGDWFLTPRSSGGGPMIDLGVHRLDLTLHLMGYPKPTSVSGVAYRRLGPIEAARVGKRYEIEDAAMALIRFEDGAAVYVEASYFLNAQDEGQATYLYGTSGGVVMDSGQAATFRVDGEETVDLPVIPVPSAPNSCVEHFANVLLGREVLVSTPEQALALTRILDAIYASAETGETIAL